MNWIFRKLESLFRKSGNPETRDLEIRESGDQGQKPSVPDPRLTGSPDTRNRAKALCPGSPEPGAAIPVSLMMVGNTVAVVNIEHHEDKD